MNSCVGGNKDGKTKSGSICGSEYADEIEPKKNKSGKRAKKAMVNKIYMDGIDKQRQSFGFVEIDEFGNETKLKDDCEESMAFIDLGDLDDGPKDK